MWSSKKPKTKKRGVRPTAKTPSPPLTPTAMDTGIMPAAVARLHAANRLVQAINDAHDAAVAANDPEAQRALVPVGLDAENRRANIALTVTEEIRAHMRSVCPHCARNTPYINNGIVPSTTHSGDLVCEAARESLILKGAVVCGIGEARGNNRVVRCER